MTMDQAVEVLALAERARRSIAKHGEIPADWVAQAYGVSRGAGLSLIVEAQRTREHGEVCRICGGTGRIQHP